VLAGTLLVNVVEIFSGATIIISLFASTLTELISTNPSVMVNLVLNPVVEGESYLTIGLVEVAPVGVPPGKFQDLPVGEPNEVSWYKI
jgi:hypothetical protein